jgi:LruC domain-containing protein
MFSLSRFWGTVCSLSLVAIMMTACVNTSLYENHDPEDDVEAKTPNSFDFSTVQKVKLNIDYSAFNTHGPVFFGVYIENPIIEVEDAPDDKWDENVTPIYEDYTESNGKFSAVVELPTYAQHLYIATGNFFIGMNVMEADVQNGAVTVVAKNNHVSASRAATRALGPGESTDDISKLNLTSTVNSSGKVIEKIYNDWKNWLGTWNSATGRPDYLLNKATANSQLVISDEEMEGLYAAVNTAFVSGSAMNEEYSSYPDLLLTQDSEVTFTLLGGSTCWNSSLGYYYYTDDNKPTTPKDINPIMIFPNTQDGQWARASIKLGSEGYRGNIGTLRGDVVQLMYYPNIANNDKSGATTVFPKGTRIGFVLKTQAWSMQGKSYSCDVSYGANKYNCWCTTTDGLSYAKQVGTESMNHPIVDGESRGAKFSYKAANGNTYTLVSFEDAMDDKDFDDLIFALKPVGVFAPVPEIEDKKSSTNDVYAFEDLWPKKGDYDLNDAVVNVKHEKEFKNGKIIKESFYLTTYQNYVELTSGLALTLDTKVTPKTIVMKKIAKSSTVAEETSFAQDGNVYYLTNDFKGELGTTYIIELTYKSALSSSGELASIQPFIYRSEGDLNWEVHIPLEAPTAKMNLSYFGQGDDCSDPSKGLYFVRSGNYPFAFRLKGANIKVFEDTILKRENESKQIDELFPGFLEWSTSGGTTNQNWYIK